MASDRFGRRPILILGPLGLTVAIIAFGMSTQFWPLVFFRCLQGTFNGNIGVAGSFQIRDKNWLITSLTQLGVTKTVIGEVSVQIYYRALDPDPSHAKITDKTNIADAFTLMPLVWSAGSILGYVHLVLVIAMNRPLLEPDPWWGVISPSSSVAGYPRKNHIPQKPSVLPSMFCSCHGCFYDISVYHCWT
jgi:MFS family permease